MFPFCRNDQLLDLTSQIDGDQKVENQHPAALTNKALIFDKTAVIFQDFQ